MKTIQKRQGVLLTKTYHHQPNKNASWRQHLSWFPRQRHDGDWLCTGASGKWDNKSNVNANESFHRLISPHPLPVKKQQWKPRQTKPLGSWIIGVGRSGHSISLVQLQQIPAALVPLRSAGAWPPQLCPQAAADTRFSSPPSGILGSPLLPFSTKSQKLQLKRVGKGTAGGGSGTAPSGWHGTFFLKRARQK